MSIPVQFTQFKAAGIYRIVYDKSTVLNQDAEILRLVVGFSEIGPFNIPVYVKTVSEFKATFGDISKKLEKRGVYFHRMAIQALAAGPILCLNLKKFDERNKIYASAISTEVNGNSIDTREFEVKEIYDTTKFWELSAERLIDLNFGASTEKTYINIAATDAVGNSASYFIRKASGKKVNGYNITVSDWYKSLNEEVPEYLEKYLNAKISDFFAEIYVFGGQFIKEQVLASNSLKNYFEVKDDELVLRKYVINAYGDAIDTLDELFVNDAANPIAHYIGCTIPYFKDSMGQYQALDIIFNNDIDTHHLMMNLNADLLDTTDVNINLSCYDDIDDDLIAAVYAGEAHISLLGNEDAAIFGDKISYDEAGEVVVEQCSEEEHVYDASLNFIDAEGWEATDDINGLKAYKSEDTDLWLKILSQGEAIIGEDGIVYVQDAWAESETTTEDVPYTNEEIDAENTAHSHEETTYPDGYTIKSEGDVKKEVLYTAEEADAENATHLIADENGIEPGEEGYVTTYEPEYTPISEGDVKEVVYYTAEEAAAENAEHATIETVYDDGYPLAAGSTHQVEVEKTISYVTFSDNVKIVSAGEGTAIVRVANPLNQEIGTFKPIYLKGYDYPQAKPAGTDMLSKLNWQNEVLDTLNDIGIHSALLNKSEIDYRYIVDTFESFVDNGCKDKLSFLAKEKESAFAILNFPSVRTFVKCPYASFVNDKGIFNVQYIVDGSNKKKAASKKFTLPGDPEGASFCAFYTPLKFSDGYIDSIIPSAGLVSNLFMEKYKSRQPYYIIAGPNYGVMSASGLIGPDYHYTKEELNIIEPYGVNCMVYRPGFGTFINANQTAKQSPKSALSSVNVRELVIYLQDEIEKVLQAYQWEFNNPITRDAIKTRADVICERTKKNGGLQDYLNIMDESNNTPDIIDNEMAVLSTHIEPGRGMGKMIHELTIYRTGMMRSQIING